MIISNVQLDPFGYCNSKCWYCPVRYEGNKSNYNKHMSIELMEKILLDIITNKGILVNNTFNHCYVSHYNEILLYKYFDEMLELFRKYKLKFMILSNGVPLTEDKLKLIQKYNDVISGICLNIPSINKELWIKYTNQTETDFDTLLHNLSMIDKYIPNYIDKKAFSIGVNGLNTTSLYDNGGWVDLLDNMIPYDINNELDTCFSEIKDKFNNVLVFKVPDLIDRAGFLHKYRVFSNYRGVLYRNKKNKIIGCNNSDRLNSWLHINSLGECFLCCNDFHFTSIYGDFKNNELKEFYNSDKHREQILNHFNSLCLQCVYAKWE